MTKRNLQLFTEGSTTEGMNAGSTDATTGADSYSDVGASNDHLANGNADTEDIAASFQNDLKGKYKDVGQKHFEGLLNKRMKKHNEELEQYKANDEKLKPMFESLGLKYGVKGNDIDAIINAVANDESILEDYAMSKNVDIDIARQLLEAERLTAAQEQADEEAKQKAEFDQFMNDLREQGNALKQMFPSFDLDIAMQNPDFQDRVFKGYSVEDAYKNAYFTDIMNGGMQFVYDRAKQEQALANKQKANRPNEKLSNAQQSNGVNIDYSKITSQQRAKINELISQGYSYADAKRLAFK